MATEPGKLPAIVIDTLYMSSGNLVVEYEALRPFERISLSVRSSWESATKDAKPVLLSGNKGKGKTSVPVHLITDEAIHFNVFLTGGQFVNKGDSVKYEFFTFKSK